MKYGRNKNKIFASLCIFFVVVFAFVALAVSFPQKKVNAGVIIEQSPQAYLQEYLTTENYESDLYIQTISNVVSGGTGTLFNVYINNTSSGNYDQRGTISIFGINQEFSGITLSYYAFSQAVGGQGGSIGQYSYIIKDNYIYINLTNIFTNILSIGNNQTLLQNYSIQLRPYSQTPVFYKMANAIKASQNIFDVENNTLTLLYLSDISGLNTSAMRDEITINWGCIDQSDDTIYAEYAPTISAQNLLSDDNTIRLGLPVNAQGDAMQYYDISQRAILSISGISTGSATATANIYGVYVWKNDNNVKWGLANFNTATNPQSAMSMNYITSFTELFDYQNVNTITMTCRLSVSNNFNFITIKNQTSVNVDNVNNVIQQGGFLPAWAVYNWARGTYSGFIAGEAYSDAQYVAGQPKYEAIFQAGYKAGFDSAEIGTGAWFITAFDAVDRFLNINIFPNITFGVLLGIPFVISLAWFIIRMFRGGGGD